MQTFETMKPGYHSRNSRTLTSMLLVGSLHVAAIYTLLVALDVVPNPVARPPPPISVRVLPQTKTTVLPPIGPMSGVVLTHPTLPSATPPPIEIGTAPTGPTIYVPPAGPAVPTAPVPGATSPLRAIAATHTIPPYPPLALRLAHEGTARLKIAVGEMGNVVEAEVVQSTGHEELDAAAIAWVKTHWRYQPALKAGQAVATSTDAIVTFRLDQAR